MWPSTSQDHGMDSTHPHCSCYIHLSSLRRVSFITGSYDRTCKVWDTTSGEELHTLEGHRNVVYAIAFNNPFGSAIAIYCACIKIGSMSTSLTKYYLQFHVCTVLKYHCSCFLPSRDKIATGSFDKTCKVRFLLNRWRMAH